MKECPLCGELIKAKAIKCIHCGENIQQHQAEQEAAVERVLFEGNPAAVYTAGQIFWCVVTLGVAYLVYHLRSKKTTYRVTSQRINIERGVLSKSEEMVELYRAQDFELMQPIGMRLLGYSVLVVVSSDPSSKRTVLYGLKNSKELREELRDCMQKEQKRRGVGLRAGV